MTFTSYLTTTNQLTAWAVGTPSERESIRNAWERQAHFVFNQPGYSFRMAGERHAETEGITDTMVQAHIDKAARLCKVENCGNVALSNGNGFCLWCLAEVAEGEEQAAVYENLANPYRRKYWHMVAFAVVCVVVTLAVIVGVVRSGVGG